MAGIKAGHLPGSVS